MSISISILMVIFFLVKSVSKGRLQPKVSYLILLLITLKLFIPFGMYQQTDRLFPETGENGVSSDASAVLEQNSDFLENNGETPLTYDASSITEAVSNNSLTISLFWLKTVSIIWLAGFFLLIIVFATTEILLYKKISRCKQVENENLLEMVEAIQQEMQLFKTVEVLESGLFSSPAVYGLLKPKLIIPNIDAFMEFDHWKKRNILIHELSHIKRHDNPIRFLISAICMVYWFNPFIWILFSNVRNAQEMLCDRNVLVAIPETKRRNYADLILDLYGQPNKIAYKKIPAFLSSKSLMKDRIIHVLFYKKGNRLISLGVTALVIIAFLLSFTVFVPGTTEAYDSMIWFASTINTVVEPPMDTIIEIPTPSDAPFTETLLSSDLPLDENAYVVFTDVVLAEMLAAHFNTSANTLTVEMMESIEQIEIWGDIFGINTHYMSLISYFGSAGYGMDQNGRAINTRGDITSLKDISLMPNIETLSVNNNDISDFPDFSKLTGLRTVRLMNDNLKDISMLSALHSVDELYICNNRISELTPIADLSNLKILWLGFNNIRTISDLSNMAALQQLRLESNNITDISGLENCTGLQELNLAINNIKDISVLSSVTGLSQLALLQNKILDISPLKNLTYLRSLYINNNYITDISALSEMKMLDFLNASHNYIKDISPLLQLTSLSELLFVENLATVDESIFEQLYWVSNIKLEY
ncbi:MAG: M56 family metallopeptidase [Clostridia bacterium]